MTASDIRATFSIAALFSLRMLGLFMILPVFTLYAHTLNGATPFLIGAALGVYGLTQAVFQLPFGALSDHYSRKKIIALGFGIFIAGSFIAAGAHSIYSMMAGRALQGAGAVGSTLIALLTDLIRPEKRARCMALLGMTIGCSFFLAFLLGPLLQPRIEVHGIFVLSGILGICAIVLLYTVVPSPVQTVPVTFSPPQFKSDVKLLLKNKQLLSLNLGIFCLHAILTASFIVIPLSVSGWTVYLVPLLISFLLTFVFIGIAEKTKKVFPAYFLSMTGLIIAQLWLWHFQPHITGLTLFFLSFNLMEAMLPSLVSRLAPAALKGTALGIYSTCQFAGIFLGGLAGGLVYQYFAPPIVLLSCALLGIVWLGLSLIIRFSRRTLWQEV
jgi:MFS family permease